MCLGRQAQERQLLQCAIPPPSRAPRSEEGGLCSCGFTAHDHLPHAQGRYAIPGSRCGPFRSPLQRREGQAPGRSVRKPWLRCQAYSLRPSSLRLLPCCNRNADQTTPHLNLVCGTAGERAARSVPAQFQCKLRLDEPVDRLLPELAHRKVLRRIDGPLEDTVPATRPITLRDLLTFRIGFGLIWGPPDKDPIQTAVS